MEAFSPSEFGEKLRAIRERKGLTLELAETTTGVEMHNISRIERGAIEKPSFQQIVDIGKGYNLTPNEMAALAGLYVIDDNEQSVLDDEVWIAVNDIRNYLNDVNDDERKNLLELTSLLLDTHKRRKKANLKPVGNDVLPEWLRL